MKWLRLLSPAAIARLIKRALSVRDIVFFGTGLAAICYGVAQIYPPAAWIIGGIVFLVMGLI